MAADILTTAVPSGDIRGATAASCRALQADAAPGAAFNAPCVDDYSNAEPLRRAAISDGSGSLKVALGKWLEPIVQLEWVFHLTDVADVLACETWVSPPSTSVLPVSTTRRNAELTAEGPVRPCGSSIRRRATRETRYLGTPGRAGPCLSPGAMLWPAALARVAGHPLTCKPA
jgi:hypothetical protein